MTQGDDFVLNLIGLRQWIANSHYKLRRGQVWCKTCGSTRHVDPAQALRHGWPKCCGFTMTIDSPAERVAVTNSIAPPPQTPEGGER